MSERVVLDGAAYVAAAFGSPQSRDEVQGHSLPAETPALVMRSPSSTNRAATSVHTVLSSSESRFSDAQCVVAVRPFSSPAAA